MPVNTIPLTSPTMQPIGGDDARRRSLLSEILRNLKEEQERRQPPQRPMSSSMPSSSPSSSPSLPDLTSGPNNGATSLFDKWFGGTSSAPGFTPNTNYAGVPDEAFWSSSGAPANTAGQQAAGGFGGSGVGMSNLAGGATPLLYAYLIGKGKMMENERLQKDPGDPLGNFGLAMLAPSGKQILEDPKGMGLPTLFGLPFLTPFTASDKAKQTKPEWSGLWEGLGL